MPEVKRGRPAKDNQAVTFKLSTDLVEKLNQYAAENGTSKVDVVEDALNLYFQEKKAYVLMADAIDRAFRYHAYAQDNLEKDIALVLSGAEFNKKCREVIFDTIKDYFNWNKIIPTSNGGLRVTRNLIDENITLDDLVNRNYTPEKKLVSDVLRNKLKILIDEEITKLLLEACEKEANKSLNLSCKLDSYMAVKNALILKTNDIVMHLSEQFEAEYANLNLIFRRYNPNMQLFKYSMPQVLENISVDF